MCVQALRLDTMRQPTHADRGTASDLPTVTSAVGVALALAAAVVAVSYPAVAAVVTASTVAVVAAALVGAHLERRRPRTAGTDASADSGQFLDAD